MRRSSGGGARLEALRRELARGEDPTAARPGALVSHPAHPSSKSFFIETRGCQMNVSDSEVVRRLLGDAAFVEAPAAAAADVVLLNTCAIREGSERKVWNRLRTLRRRQTSSDQKIAVLGCMAERVKADLHAGGLADVVVGPDAYRSLPALLAAAGGGAPQIDTQLSRTEDYGDVAPARADPAKRHGAFVSVQRGCDNNCAYCIVPYVRGRERSRSTATVLAEVAALYGAGVREMTLLGQNVNSYHDRGALVGGGARAYTEGFAPLIKSDRRDALEGGARFADLLVRVAASAPDARIRFTSPHPKDFPESLLDAVAETPNVAKQLHLPCQSGSDAVLDAMRRGYTNAAYRDLIARARAKIPNVALSSDFIAGFCGETDADHDATLALLRDVRYDMAFLYAYSERDRTRAHRRLADDVDPEAKARRLGELIATFREHRVDKAAEALGVTSLVLVEGPPKRAPEGQVGPFSSGRDDANRRLIFPGAFEGSALEPGDFVHVVPDRSSPGGGTLFGAVVARAAGAGDRPVP